MNRQAAASCRVLPSCSTWRSPGFPWFVATLLFCLSSWAAPLCLCRDLTSPSALLRSRLGGLEIRNPPISMSSTHLHMQRLSIPIKSPRQIPRLGTSCVSSRLLYRPVLWPQSTLATCFLIDTLPRLFLSESQPQPSVASSVAWSLKMIKICPLL